MKLHILCDIDHCVADAAWRDNLIGGEGGWDAYHDAAKDDKPITDIIAILVSMQAQGCFIIGNTTRPEKWRQATQAWLLKHSIPIDSLLMRPDDDFRPTQEVKLDQARSIFTGDEDIRKHVLFVLDDNERVITAFRGIGVTALQVFAR